MSHPTVKNVRRETQETLRQQNRNPESVAAGPGGSAPVDIWVALVTMAISADRILIGDHV